MNLHGWQKSLWKADQLTFIAIDSQHNSYCVWLLTGLYQLCVNMAGVAEPVTLLPLGYVVTQDIFKIMNFWEFYVQKFPVCIW